MKYNLIFSFLLVLIMLVGIFAVDVSSKFLIDDTLKEFLIEKDSVDTGAIYLSSPNEISFNPMEIVDTFVNSVSLEQFQDREIVKAMIINMSGYSDKTKYVSPVSRSLFSDLHKSGNGYIYVEKHRYYNALNEERLMDCIVSTENDFKIVYINFYSDNEYSLSNEEMNDGINEFRNMSEQYYFKLANDDYLSYNSVIVDNFSYLGKEYALEDEQEKIDIEALAESMDGDIAPIGKINEVYNIAFNIFDRIVNNSMSNSVEYFWKRSFVLSSFMYSDYNDFSEYGYVKYIYGTAYINEIIMQDGASILKTNTEYVAHNGRIYQTIYFDNLNYHSEKIIVIYNISDGIIEGFYAPPN